MTHLDLDKEQEFIEMMAYNSALSNSITHQEDRILSGEEFYLNYGQEAAKEILPVVESYFKSLFKLRNQHHKLFFWNYMKPMHEKWLTNKKDNIDAISRTAEVVSVLLVANLSKHTTISNIASEISRSVMNQLKVDYHERAELMNKFIQFFVPVIQHVAESTDIFNIKQVDNRENYIYPSEKWADRINDCISNFGTNVSKYKPMVRIPLPHKDLLDGTGGFLVATSPLMKNPAKVDGKIHPMLRNFTAETNPEFFAEINRIQEIPYCVNVKLLAVINDYYNERKMYFGKFPITVDKSQYEEDAEKEIIKRNNRRRKYSAYKKTEYEPLKKTTESKITTKHRNAAFQKAEKTKALLAEADYYAVYNAIYFALFVDYRGRRYPYANTGLSYQGDEMAKALVQFANKRPLDENGLNSLYESLGGVLGYDKHILPVRRKRGKEFFESNVMDFIEGNFDIFFEEQDMFEEPVNALAIVMELVEYTKDPDYETGYINHRDARCSGASIIGTVMNDRNVMEMTSVIDWNDNGKLGDAYMAAAQTAEKICEAMVKEGNELAIDLYELADLLFIRKIFKHVVMTKCSYGLTDYSVRKYNEDEINWEELELTKEHKMLFDRIMLMALDKALPSCSEFLVTARNAAKQQVGKLGYICFTNPVTGFPVVHREFKITSRSINITSGFKRIQLKLQTLTDKLNNVGMCNAFSPNIVHSVDASLLTMVDMMCEHDLALIHDSIGSHPNDTYATVEAYDNSMKILSENNLFNVVFEEMGTNAKLNPVDKLGEWKGSAHIIC